MTEIYIIIFLKLGMNMVTRSRAYPGVAQVMCQPLPARIRKCAFLIFVAVRWCRLAAVGSLSVVNNIIVFFFTVLIITIISISSYSTVLLPNSASVSEMRSYCIECIIFVTKLLLHYKIFQLPLTIIIKAVSLF